jgi:hypothetical protein
MDVVIPRTGIPAEQGLTLVHQALTQQHLMAMTGFDRLRLVGDEDCGVGIQCDDCWDGGRPLGYYVGIARYYDDDPKVTVVDSIADLLAVGRAHLDEKHH